MRIVHIIDIKEKKNRFTSGHQDLIISLPRARILDFVGVGNSVQSRKNFAMQNKMKFFL